MGPEQLGAMMLGRHKRFLLAFAFGAALFAVAQWAPLSPALRALLGVNAFL